MGKGKIRKSLLIGLISAFSLLALAASSLAWFFSTITINDINGTGTTEPAYFAYGTGTAEHPYGISDTRHLNNLAWLQYNGTFDDGNYHFELASDINAGGETFVIPPIGTEDHPFKGVFDGNGHTINNIKVTNDSSSFSNKPKNIAYSQLKAEIVGFFGVVGNLSGESYSSSVNNLIDFTLKNIEVESKTSQTLIGLAAGYVNAEMSGVKIDGTATINVNGQTSTAKTAYTDKLTDYGLVGYSTKIGSNGLYQQKLSRFFGNFEGSGGGSSDNWGGSIDIQTLNTTIHAAYGSFTGTSGKDYIYTFNMNDFSMVMSRNERSSPNTVENVYRHRRGTAIPINMDNSYNALSTNTGYFVGSNIGDNTVNASPKSSSYKIDYICRSLSNKTVTYVDVRNGAQAKYNSSTLEVLTYNNNSWKRITDEYNSGHTSVHADLGRYSAESVENLGFEKYTDARRSLDAIFTQENGTSELRIHGIHYDTNVPSSSSTTVKNVSIFGESISDYPLINSSVDFNVKKSGRITFFAGTYYSMSSSEASVFDRNGTTNGYTRDTYFNDSFFSLNHVKRNASNGITFFKKISKIYKDEDGTKDAPYIYQYSDNSFSAAKTSEDTLLFDCSILDSRAPVNLALYYFEIPVNPGEYAIGAVSSSQSRGAYLVYLDIGASAQEIDTIKAYHITTVKPGNAFPLGVDFIPVAVAGNGGESIGIYIASGSQGVITFSVTTANIAITDSSSISVYSFQGGKYSAASPPSGNFSVSGNSPGALVIPSTGGERVLSIELTKVNGDTRTIQVIDRLDGEGAIISSTYKMDSGSGLVDTTEALIEAESDELILSDLRALELAATLTRATGSGEFSTVYDTANCNSTTLDVDIETNGATISVDVEDGYTFKVGGVTREDGSTYPAA